MTRNALFCLVVSTLLVGCARTVVVDPQDTAYDPNDVDAQLLFWHELPGRSAVTNNEGVHGVILLVEGADSTGSWENRLAYLDERGWLPDQLREDGPDVAMRRGVLASVLARALGIEGGVMYRLTDASPRYAYRELVYQGIMPSGSDQMILDGTDFLGVISKSEDRRRASLVATAEAASEAADELDAPVEEIQREREDAVR